MRFSGIFAASLAAVPLVAAHGDDIPMPKVFGLPKHLRARNPWMGHAAKSSVAGPQLHARQGGDANGRCGSNGGGASCAEGYCCSFEGYCGTTKEHCAAPDCQISYGPACDGNKTPAGSTTRNDARSQLGSVPYGVVIEACENPKKVAITYDDGPYIYTQDVLNAFAQYNAHATFFITGNNLGKGAIDENWTGVIQNMVAGGHQVASHTWSHQDLSAITPEQRYDQMIKNEMAIRNIIGKYPTYMRPPYSSCDSACLAVMAELGYVVSYFDLDTDDYNQLTTEKIQVAKDNFKTGIDSAGTNGDRLAIAHDIHELTAHNLTNYMLEYLYSQGFTAVTMGECLNDPEANWYRSSTPASPSSITRTSSAVSTPTGAPTVDGSCGGTTGYTCIGFTLNGALAQCCSPYNFCGNTDGHCGDGCQAGFGKCGTGANTPSPVSSTSSGPAPTPTGPTSLDGSCGGTAGYSCVGFVYEGFASECCSMYGFCGNTTGHCGTGCQAGFGKCGNQVVSSSSSSVSLVTSTSSSSLVPSSTTGSSMSSSVTASSAAATSSSLLSSSSTASSSATYSTSSSKASSSSSGPSTKTNTSTSVSSSKAFSTSASSTKASSTSSSSSKASSSSSTKASSTSAISTSAISTSVISTKASSISSSSNKASPSSFTKASSTSASSTKVSSTPSPTKPSSTPTSTTLSTSSSRSSSTSSSRASTTVSTTLTTILSASSSRSSSSAPSSASSSRGTTLSTTKSSSTSSARSSYTGLPVSTNGRCGTKNGGVTCEGYRNSKGIKVECCGRDSGVCGYDVWSCGFGCDDAFGNCWFS